MGLGVALAACTAGGPASSARRPLEAGFATATPDARLAAGLPGSRRFDPAVALLRGPHYAWSVLAVAEVGSALPDELADALGVARDAAPLPGSRLLLLDLERPPRISYVTVDAARTMAFEVTAGSATRRLPMPPLGEPFSGSLAVAVPAGGDAVLTITDEGRRQTLDLVTGRRGADAAAGYYPLRTADPADPAGEPVEVAVPGSRRRARLDLDEVEAGLPPWRSDRGWARPGRAWLTVGAALTLRGDPGPPPEITVPARCFTATGTDGARYALSGDAVTIGGDTGPGSDSAELVADVPASLASVTVTFRSCGTGPARTVRLALT